MSAPPSALPLDDDPGLGDKRPVIDKHTLVPIYFVLGALAVGYGFLNYLDHRFSPVDQIARSVTEIGYRLDAIEASLAERWTATHQKMWELQMRQLNPNLVIPNTWEITGRRP